jgi:hypothetical protein
MRFRPLRARRGDSVGRVPIKELLDAREDRILSSGTFDFKRLQGAATIAITVLPPVGAMAPIDGLVALVTLPGSVFSNC